MNLSFQSPFIGGNQKELTDARRISVCQDLEIMYNGESDNIASSNINRLITNPENRKRLKQLYVNFNLIRRPWDTINSAYTQRGIRRVFENATDAENDRLNEIYMQLDINNTLLRMERMSALCGTAFLMPRVDEVRQEFYFTELTPAEVTLKIKHDINRPEILTQLEYKIGSTVHWWDDEEYKIYDSKNPKVLLEGSGPLEGLGMIPWVPLRYRASRRRFWGYVATDVWRFAIISTLLLSHPLVRSMSDMTELLLFVGVKEQDIKVIVESVAMGRAAATIPGAPKEMTQPDAKYLSPAYEATGVLTDLADYYYTLFLRSLGVTPKNFEVGADVQSAESQRISDQAVRNRVEENKIMFVPIEQEIFKRVVWQNNIYTPKKGQISNKVRLLLDWPEARIYNTMKDKWIERDKEIQYGMSHPIFFLMNDNIDYTEEDARARMKKVQELRKEEKLEAAEEEQIVEEDTDDENPIPQPRSDESKKL